MGTASVESMRDGLRKAAAAVQNFTEGCEALRGQVGREVVAEHLDLSLRRLRSLRRELAARADAVASGDAVFIALGLGAAGLSSLADAFAEMHVRYRATLPGHLPEPARFEEDGQQEAEADGLPG